MNGHRWGFEEAEDWEYDEPQEPASPGEDLDTPVIPGQDPDAVVAVKVSPAADVLSVKLATEWKQAVDPVFASGIVVLASRSCVSTGWLKCKSAYNFRAALSAAFTGSLAAFSSFIVLYPVTVLDSRNHPPQPQLHFTLPIVLYMLSPVLAAALTGVNFFVSSRLLRPSPALLHRYSRPGPGW